MLVEASLTARACPVCGGDAEPGRFQRAKWSPAWSVLIRRASSRRANGWAGLLRT
jgi:hypothetical protein